MAIEFCSCISLILACKLEALARRSDLGVLKLCGLLPAFLASTREELLVFLLGEARLLRLKGRTHLTEDSRARFEGDSVGCEVAWSPLLRRFSGET